MPDIIDLIEQYLGAETYDIHKRLRQEIVASRVDITSTVFIAELDIPSRFDKLLLQILLHHLCDAYPDYTFPDITQDSLPHPVAIPEAAGDYIHPLYSMMYGTVQSMNVQIDAFPLFAILGVIDTLPSTAMIDLDIFFFDVLVEVATPDDEEVIAVLQDYLERVEYLPDGGSDVTRDCMLAKCSLAGRIIHLLSLFQVPETIDSLIHLREAMEGKVYIHEITGIDRNLANMNDHIVLFLFEAVRKYHSVMPHYLREILISMKPIDALIKQMMIHYGFARLDVIKLVGELHIDIAMDALTTLLQDNHNDIRLAAIRALGHFSSDQVDDLLDAHLEVEADPRLIIEILSLTASDFDRLYEMQQNAPSINIKHHATTAIVNLLSRYASLDDKQIQLLNTAQHHTQLNIRMQATAILKHHGLLSTDITPESFLLDMADYRLGDKDMPGEFHGKSMKLDKGKASPTFVEVINTSDMIGKDIALYMLARWGDVASVIGEAIKRQVNDENRRHILVDFLLQQPDASRLMSIVLQTIAIPAIRFEMIHIILHHQLVDCRHGLWVVANSEGQNSGLKHQTLLTLAEFGDEKAIRELANLIRSQVISQPVRVSLARSLGNIVGNSQLIDVADNTSESFVVSNGTDDISDYWRDLNHDLFDVLKSYR